MDELGGLHDALEALKTELAVSDELRVASADPKKHRLSSWFEQSSRVPAPQERVELSVFSEALLDRVGQLIPALNAEIKPGQPYLLPYHWFEGGGSALKSR